MGSYVCAKLLRVQISVAVVDGKSRDVSLLVTNNVLLCCASNLMLLTGVMCLNHILYVTKLQQVGNNAATTWHNRLYTGYIKREHHECCFCQERQQCLHSSLVHACDEQSQITCFATGWRSCTYVTTSLVTGLSCNLSKCSEQCPNATCSGRQ